MSFPGEDSFFCSQHSSVACGYFYRIGVSWAFPAFFACSFVLSLFTSCSGNQVGETWCGFWHYWETHSQQIPWSYGPYNISSLLTQYYLNLRWESVNRCTSWESQLYFDQLWFSVVVFICCKAKFPRWRVKTTLICGSKDKCLDFLGIVLV